jgi:hypothetical protein
VARGEALQVWRADYSLALCRNQLTNTLVASNGAGRKSEGKKAVLVTLTEKNVKRAKKREDNFSGLLDRLLADWIER